MNLRKQTQIAKDLLKRKCIDFVRKDGRLQTTMQVQVNTLRCYSYLPQRIIAVEIFGMHGLWITKDYAHICTYLELWEIDRVYAAAAKKYIKNAVVMNGDSIRAVLNKKLMRDSYNFIVSDNPMGAPYGDNYYEHFNLFPTIIDYVDDGGGVIQLNFVHNPISLSYKHMDRRASFYGKANPSIAEASDIYRHLVVNVGRILKDVLFVPRNDRIGFLSLIIGARNELK
jgi:hypothetical protein